MPGFAKFLVFINFVAACAFLYIATIDYNARRPWAYEVFLGEMAVDGLPLDERDPGPRRIDTALFDDLDESGHATLRQLFANAGGNPPEKGGKVILTQQDEVAYQKAKINKLLDEEKDDDRKREMIRDYILPMTLTLEERDYWVKRYADKDYETKMLQEDLNREFFDRALKKEVYNEGTHQYEIEKANPQKSERLNEQRAESMEEIRKKYPEKYIRPTRRQHVAHLLYNLSGMTGDDKQKSEEHTRVMVVIGLKAYIGEAESQAARLREMSLRTRMAMVDERSLFEVEYQRLLQRIYTLSEELEAKKLFYKDKEGIRDRTKELAEVREKDRNELKNQLGKAETELKTALAHQEWWEQQIFDTQKKLGDMQSQAENLQRYIKRLEGAGYR
jgi:hypothetical protein